MRQRKKKDLKGKLNPILFSFTKRLNLDCKAQLTELDALSAVVLYRMCPFISPQRDVNAQLFFSYLVQ